MLCFSSYDVEHHRGKFLLLQMAKDMPYRVGQGIVDSNGGVFNRPIYETVPL